MKEIGDQFQASLLALAASPETVVGLKAALKKSIQTIPSVEKIRLTSDAEDVGLMVKFFRFFLSSVVTLSDLSISECKKVHFDNYFKEYEKYCSSKTSFNVLFSSLFPQLLIHVRNKDVSLNLKKLILKSIEKVLVKATLTSRNQLVQSHHKDILAVLQFMTQCGDYELQYAICHLIALLAKNTECQKNVPENLRKFKRFLKLSTSDFDHRVRERLNKINDKFLTVFSTVCHSVSLNLMLIRNENSAEIWVDFNLTSKSVSLHWENGRTMRVSSENVQKITWSSTNVFRTLMISLNKEISMRCPLTKDKYIGKELCITFYQTIRVDILFFDILLETIPNTKLAESFHYIETPVPSFEPGDMDDNGKIALSWYRKYFQRNTWDDTRQFECETSSDDSDSTIDDTHLMIFID